MNYLTKAGPACLLLAYTLKLVIFGAAMPDALIVAFLCSLTGLSSFIEYIKYKTELQESIEKINTRIDSHVKTLTDHEEQVKTTIAYVSNLKLKTAYQVK